MDRIYKALELAKSQGGAESVRPAPDIHADQYARAEHLEQPEEVRYTTTRVWPAKQEIVRRNRLLMGRCDPMVEACYKLLRTRVLRQLEENGWKTIGVTSARPSEGKTLTAINLGLAIARDPKYSVLLVDADLRMPSLHTAFGYEPEWGLEDYLARRAPLHELLVNPGVERFVILPSHTHVQGSSEHLTSKRMSGLVQELKSRYPSRFVMFDLPPALVADDVVAFSSQLDAVLVVVEDGKTQAEDLKRMLELLEGTEILGTVLNKVSQQDDKHNYYYREPSE